MFVRLARILRQLMAMSHIYMKWFTIYPPPPSILNTPILVIRQQLELQFVDFLTWRNPDSPPTPLFTSEAFLS